MPKIVEEVICPKCGTQFRTKLKRGKPCKPCPKCGTHNE